MKTIWSIISLLITQQLLFSQEEIKKPVTFLEEYFKLGSQIDYNDIITWKDHFDFDQLKGIIEEIEIDTFYTEQGVLENVNGINLPLTLQYSVSTKIDDKLNITVLHQRMAVLNIIIGERIVVRKQCGMLYSTEEYKFKFKESFTKIDNTLGCEFSIMTGSDNIMRIDLTTADRYAVSICNMQGQIVLFEELGKSYVINDDNFNKNEFYLIFIENLETKELCSKKYIKM